MLAPVIHILGLTSFRRTRLLPISGQVTARLGQKVVASDVIAEASVPARHILLDVRRTLGYARADEAERVIVRKEGERVAQGDVIAETGGMFSRIVRAPQAGQVVMISAGRVLLEVESRPMQLQAGAPGTVVEVIQERGVIIETNGALVQGVWGNSRVGEGMLANLLKTPADELTPAMLDVSLRGAVVLGGICLQAETLRAGADLPLRGLILASMSADLVPVASGVEYPVLVLDGFGRVPMNEAAYRLLTTNEKRDAAVNAAFNPVTGERPEVILALPGNAPLLQDAAYFKAGQTVRINGAPYQSRIGVIVQIRPGMTVLPNGLRAPAADIRLDPDAQVTVPLANLEVVQ